MRILFAIVVLVASFNTLSAQSGTGLLQQLQRINDSLQGNSMQYNTTPVISNRGLNIFLADKTAYLFGNADLSYFSNYVSYNGNSGILAVNHNFYHPVAADQLINRMFQIGVKARVSNGFDVMPGYEQNKKEAGFTVGYAFLQKPRVSYVKRGKEGIDPGVVMSRVRDVILQQLADSGKFHSYQANNHNFSLDSDSAIAKNVVHKYLLARAEKEYLQQYAQVQAEVLSDLKLFNTITTGWTNISAYVPVLFPRYAVVTLPGGPITRKHPYNASLMLQHTRLWERATAGRLFASFSGNVFLNNSVFALEHNRLAANEYVRFGGADTLALATLGNDVIFEGDYATFLTPSLQARLVYYSPGSHIGISGKLEKFFGTYAVTNVSVGLPLVLINKQNFPVFNIDVFVTFFDVFKTKERGRKQGKLALFGINIGVPFSRMLY